jgi:hypothetical protein
LEEDYTEISINYYGTVLSNIPEDGQGPTVGMTRDHFNPDDVAITDDDLVDVMRPTLLRQTRDPHFEFLLVNPFMIGLTDNCSPRTSIFVAIGVSRL